jgi:Raf kinase inhibitor-like YbhB/YbcL family protein
MKRGVTSFLAMVAMCSLAPFCALALELKSPDISADKPIGEKFIYNSFGCAGGNLSPELVWTDPPEGTKSFAVLAHDPDAPTGGAGFWHWIVVDIPATARSLPQGAGDVSGGKLPPGARQLETDFGDASYGGPCPPPGAPHRYVFTVYALKIAKLGDLARGRTAAIGFAINQNALAKAALTSRYGR